MKKPPPASTLVEPLNFFLWFYDIDILKKYEHWFYREAGSGCYFFDFRNRIPNTELDWEAYWDSKMDESPNRTEGYKGYFNSRTSREDKLYFKDDVKSVLNRQAEITQSIIAQQVYKLLLDSKDYEKIIDFYLNQIDNLKLKLKLNQLSIESTQYNTTILREPLLLMQNTIKLRYKVYKPKKTDNQHLMFKIFDYMKNKNNNDEIILEENEYNLLISYNIKLVEEKIVPDNVQPLNPKIPKELIKFSYWVLHKELHGTNNIKANYLTFLIKVFKKFEDDNDVNLRKHFGTKGRIKKHDYIPRSIKKYMK